MDSLDAIFRAFDGPAAVGRAIGVTTEHAAAMRRRGSIPAVYWPSLVGAAERAGIAGLTLDALTEINIAEKGRRRAPRGGGATPEARA